MQLRLRVGQLLIALIVLLSLYSSISYLIWTQSAGTVDFDHVADWDARFTPVKEALPIQRGTLGYIADWDIPGADFAPSDQDAEFILTQFSFAPFILVRGVDQEWIIGSLSPRSYETWVQIRDGEYKDYKFKGNVYLFHRLDLTK
jgi:hypothetical protein